MHGTLNVSESFDVDQWIHLNSGDRVLIQRAGEYLNTGHIDDINEDATVIWVWLDHGRGRILVHEGDKAVIRKLS